MSRFIQWIDDRTGIKRFTHEALYENIPGGSRWRYVWGSTLVFAFFVQMVTGIVLWMSYSPSTQTAWESVYYIEYGMTAGWLLRGVHHFMAQAMVVLLAIHLLQVVIHGAYKAPREFNFWIGLILMQIVLGLSLTGYLLPWDQKGYWATKVATKIAGGTPLVGQQIQQLVQGGTEYGHHTLTRFFALHAGVLPGLLIAFLVIHIALFRKHGITAKEDPTRENQYFWPGQVLKDAIACMAVMIVVILLTVFLRAELGAPADPATEYAAARPEWYFLFLFQTLKLFPGFVGAFLIPGGVMLVLFLMPILGRWKLGHAFNVAFLFGILAGAAVLTGLAWNEDNHARFVDAERFQEVEKVLAEIQADLDVNKDKSKYNDKTEAEQIELYFGNGGNIVEFMRDLRAFRAYEKSRDHIAAVEDAHKQAERAIELAATGIPPAGALEQMRSDPKTQGPRLFKQYCASCHDHADAEGNGILAEQSSAPNLYRFASRDWIAGALDHERAFTDQFFGNTAHVRKKGEIDGEVDNAQFMDGFVADDLSSLNDEGKQKLAEAVVALSAEAQLNYQQAEDAKAANDGTLEVGRKALTEFSFNDSYSCVDCHKVRGEGESEAPDLTGYGSRQWLIDFISDPSHARFYGKDNDRMPAFAKNPRNKAPSSRAEALVDTAATQNRIPSRRDLEMLVDWLRHDWYEPEAETPTGDEPAAAADGDAVKNDS